MQMDLRERVAVAMSVRSQFDDGGTNMETTIGALAGADELGRVLWRMRYGEMSRSLGFARAVPLLAKRLSGRSQGGRRGGWLRAGHGRVDGLHDRLACRAVSEWFGERCAHCHGLVVGGVPDDGHPLGERAYCCACCQGTGRHQYPDAERACSLGLSLDVYRKYWAQQLGAALVLLDSCDAAAEAAVRAQLAAVAKGKNCD